MIPDAEAEARQAIQITDNLASDQPDVLTASVLATTTLAHVLALRKDYEGATRLYSKAVRLQDQLIATHGASVDHRAELAKLRLKRTDMLVSSHQREGAVESCQQTLELYRSLIGEYPRVPLFRTSLCNALDLLATLLSESGDHERAERARQEVCEVHQLLHEQFPSQVEHLRSLALAYSKLMMFLCNRNRTEEAKEAIDTALQHIDDLVAAHPDVPAYRFEKSNILNSWGVQQHSAGRLKEAGQAYTESISISQELSDQYPELPSFTHNMAMTRGNLAMVLEHSDPERSEQQYRLSIAAASSLIERCPQEAKYRERRAHSRTGLGILLENQRRLDEAEREYRMVLATRTSVFDLAPGRPEVLNDMGGAELNLGSVLERLGQMESAIEHLERGVEYDTAALALNPDNPWYRDYFRSQSKLLSEIHQGLGHREDVFRVLRRYEATLPQDADILRSAADLWARCGARSAADESLATVEREAVVNDYLAESIRALECALELGYRKTDDFSKDEPWAILRGRSEFDRVAAAIRAPR